MHYLTNGNPKLRCQGLVLLEGLKKTLFHVSPLVSGQVLAIFSIAWLVETLHFHIHITFSIMCISVSKFPLYVKIPAILEHGPTLLSMTSCQLIISAASLLTNKVIFWSTGVGHQNEYGGGHNSTHNILSMCWLFLMECHLASIL